jgi:hypothetical protein
MLSRRRLLALAALAAGSPRLVVGEAPETPAARARAFLRARFDPTLGLLPEYEGATVAWLYHDNYLAAKALDASDPAIARRVREAIAGYGETRSGKVEILFDEAPSPLPFRVPVLVDVAKVGRIQVRTERLTDRVHRDWRSYADLLLYDAIARRKAEPGAANASLGAAVALWDGVGLRDRVVAKQGIYATYKLALLVLAARKLGRTLAEEAAVLARMVGTQGPSGGFVTDYGPDGRPRGLANVETTCLCLFALEAAAG